jgi:hypothetical protein
MRLTRRLLVALIGCLLVVVVSALAAVGERTRRVAREDLHRALAAEAALAARLWRPGDDPTSIADSITSSGSSSPSSAHTATRFHGPKTSHRRAWLSTTSGGPCTRITW